MSPAALLRPRPYQREALDAVRAAGLQRPAVVLPTGAGKTVCFAHQAREWLDEHPADRVVVLVHTDELVSQAYGKLLEIAPHLNVGIVKARRRDVRADVIVASVQSLRSEQARREITSVGLIIVDECHHAATATYMAILWDWGGFTDGGPTVVGYTATLVRGDGKSLGAVWQGVVFQRDISWMIRRRYLVDVRGLAVEVPDLDLRRVKSTRTDYRDGELGEALAESLAPEIVAKAYAEHAGDRRGLLFAPTVASAEVFAQAFRDQGITAELIHGGMPLGDKDNPAPGTRRYILARHRAGAFQVLCNCMLLTEGYDDPAVACVVVARPTKSRGLYIQMVGRGLRVDPALDYGTQDCLVLDVVGASAYNDLRSVVDLSEKEIKEARKGRTLTELEDEFDAGEGVAPDEVPYYSGDVVAREFNPLGAPSARVWLKTRDGVFFLPAGKTGYVFIHEYPGPGLWSVSWCGVKAVHRFAPDADGVPRLDVNGRPVGMTAHRGLPLDQALSWAEDLAVDMGVDLNAAKRTAPWRKKPPSDALKGFASGLGLVPVEGERMGALSDRVNVVMGSRRIDPIVRSVNGSQ